MKQHAQKGEAMAFLKRAISSYTNACIVWPFSTTKRGYAKVAVKRVTRDAGRVVCERVHGSAPTPKHETAHSCGNRLCINHEHLRWDTRRGNHADKLKHGTHQRGERCPTHKLTEQAVLAIRAAPTTHGLAKQYGVSRAQVIRIRERAQWGWL